MDSSGRSLDIVVLGATGYTGKWCAEHITKHHPTNLKWGIAGRSVGKLKALSEELQKEVPDRKSPEILQAQLNDAELGAVARKTKVLINCIGPYHIYSSPVVAACADSGTHYLDMTGEIPWVRKMIDKHHDTAKSKGIILISSAGTESVPTDLLSWAMASRIKEQYDVRTKDATVSGYDFSTAGASGGSITTALTLFDNTPSRELKAAQDPHCLAVFRPAGVRKAPILHRLMGVHSVPDIGTVTTSFSTSLNTPIVQRSGSLMTDLYDPNFRFWEYMNVPNVFMGLLTHFALVTGVLLLSLAPVRWLLKKVVTSPGSGPSKESTVGNRLEFRGVATAEKNGKPVRVTGRFVYEADAYSLTGLVAAEAAMVLVQNKSLVKDLGGGYLTPATLGQGFVDRLQKVGVVIETQVSE